MDLIIYTERFLFKISLVPSIALSHRHLSLKKKNKIKKGQEGTREFSSKMKKGWPINRNAFFSRGKGIRLRGRMRGGHQRAVLLRDNGDFRTVSRKRRLKGRRKKIFGGRWVGFSKRREQRVDPHWGGQSGHKEPSSIQDTVLFRTTDIPFLIHDHPQGLLPSIQFLPSSKQILFKKEVVTNIASFG